MRILIVGGTGFLGGAIAQVAVKAGHIVTVLTRGNTVTAGAQPLIADRNDLPDLKGQFDAVIDTCAYQPDHVSRLAASIGPIKSYVMISSISVYHALSEPGMDETASARSADKDDLNHAAEVPPENHCDAVAYGESYGPLKRSCEEAAIDWCGNHACNIRLGLIVGPKDYTDRFTYWVRRIDQAGDIPVPEPRERLVQLIDVADAAAFCVKQAEAGRGGTFNLTGEPLLFWDMLAQIAEIADVSPTLVPRPFATFAQHDVAAWTDLPFIIPDDHHNAGMLAVETARARDAGLVTRPLSETIKRTLEWDRAQRDVALGAGMTLEQEARVLAAIR